MGYDKEDKLEMVLEVLKAPSKAEEIATKYNIGVSTLYKWRSRFLSGGKKEICRYKPGPKEKQLSQTEVNLEEKLKEYENRIAELAAELEISKKKRTF